MTSAITVIALAGHSGSGKSTAVDRLTALLKDAIALRLDDYEDSSTYPPAKQWLAEGADPNQFLTPQFSADIRALKGGHAVSHPESGEAIKPARFIVIEEPFGKARDEIKALIDVAVYVDTPLDVAFARKFLRKNDWLPWEDDPQTFMTHLRGNLEWYLRTGRDFYLKVAECARPTCEVVADGLLPPHDLAQSIHAAILDILNQEHAS
jgi:uridine kinase